MQGPVEKKILESAQRGGMPIPRAMQEAPELGLGLQLYFQGFADLVSDRPVTGFGEGMIPWTAIQKYCEAMGLDEDQTHSMHYHIGEMDEVRARTIAKRESKANAQPIGIREKNSKARKAR